MKIVQSAAPKAPSLPTSKPSAARDRAIAAYMGGAESPAAPSDLPVANATKISPEEFTGSNAPSSLEAQSHSKEDDVSEAPKEETKVAEEPLSSQYAVLARKEKAIRQREQQLRAKEQAIKAKEEAESKAPPAPTFDESKYVSKDRVAKDPFSVLAELGLTYDQLTEMALNAPKPEQIAFNKEIDALKEELKALRGETENTKKSFEEQQTQAYQQAIAQIRNETKSLVTHSPDFEMIKETGKVEEVVGLIEKTYKEDGILMTVEEAAQLVEDYLVEDAIKRAKIKKIQQKLMPKETEAQKSTDQPKQQQLKTLTNSVGTSRPLSARERALLAFEGKLNK